MMPTGGPTTHILPEERETASFHIQTLKEIISGTKRSQAVDDFKHLFDENPVFDSEMDDFLSYPDLAEKQIVRAAEAIKTVRENPKFMVAHMAQQVAMGDMFDTGGLGIHFVAYLPFLQSQASEEQLAKWLPGARNFQYMGAYAQTELGHGSNVRGLETTASFNVETDEFVIKLARMQSPPQLDYRGHLREIACVFQLADADEHEMVAYWHVRCDTRRGLRSVDDRRHKPRRVWLLHAVRSQPQSPPQLDFHRTVLSYDL